MTSGQRKRGTPSVDKRVTSERISPRTKMRNTFSLIVLEKGNSVEEVDMDTLVDLDMDKENNTDTDTMTT